MRLSTTTALIAISAAARQAATKARIGISLNGVFPPNMRRSRSRSSPSNGAAKRRNAFRLGGIVRRVDVEEGIDRRCRPIRDRDPMTRGEGFDFVQPLFHERFAQIAPQIDRPEPDHGMAPLA